MLDFTLVLVTIWLTCIQAVTAVHPLTLGPQGVNLWKLNVAPQRRLRSTGRGDHPVPRDPGELLQMSFSHRPGAVTSKKYDFRAQWFEQPLDHFDKNSKYRFHQRYWVNSRHYKPREGAPVIVLDGGETSGEHRLPFLDTGIVEILARATGGLGVVLEHRYYGESIPVSNFSTDALRFLNNAQSAADSANFMKNVRFDGIQENLTAPGSPWIYYGGSYAGARAAHMKILYPDLVWGAIASSAVTHAALENWEYMDVIRKAADPKCSNHIVNSIKTVDYILTNSPEFIKRRLKALFGLADLEHDADFASMLEVPLGSWQAKCWDPEFGSTTFDDFCVSLSSPFNKKTAESLDIIQHPNGTAQLTADFAVDITIVNYGSWIKKNVVSECPEGQTVEDCFGTYDDVKFQDTGLDQDWRLWLFQVCTEWGYFTTAPPDQNLPRVVSHLLSLGYQSKICKQAFPPGVYFSVPTLPNVKGVNTLGDYDIAADRLAIIDGEVDPWRPQTPHSNDALNREDTVLRPFKIIPNAVHHYDEWGLLNLLEEPPEIRRIHAEMISFVNSWLGDWNRAHAVRSSA